jgi:hypothetical protein
MALYFNDLTLENFHDFFRDYSLCPVLSFVALFNHNVNRLASNLTCQVRDIATVA